MYIPIRIKAKNFGPFVELDYSFKVGKAVIVQGENLTDEGQENNGTGKSFLQEILYYSLLGTSSSGKRDIKLISRGEKEAEISFELKNEFYNHTLIIQRKLFKSKSSVLKVLINGIEQSDKFPTVAEGNKYILSLLDISSEDLKNYFLINREKFVSFFSSSDSKKRELIARFSSVDKILGIESIVEEELKEPLQEKRSCEDKLVAIDSRVETYQEQIRELESFDCDRIFEENKQKLQVTINSINSRIDSIKEELESVKVESSQLEIEKEKHQSIYGIYCKAKSKVESFDYNQLIQEQEKELDSLKTKLREKDNLINEKRDEKTELEKEIKPFSIALNGKVCCPKCSYEFTPNSDIDISEAKELVSLSKEAIKELTASIQDLEKGRQKFNELVIESKFKEIQLLENRKRKRSKLVSRIESLQLQESSTILQKERKIREFNKRTVQLELELTSQIESLKTKKKELSELKKPSLDDSQIESLREKISKQISEKESLQEKLLSIENSIIEKKKWILLIKQFYVYLTNKSLSVIEGYCNMFLQKINTDLQIKLEGFKTLADGSIKESINPVIFRDGVDEEDYRSFSGGERGRLIFSTILTFQQLINQKSKSGGLGLLFVDEVLDQVDSEGIYNLACALENVELTVLLTSQVKTKANTNNVLTVVKENGVSHIKEN